MARVNLLQRKRRGVAAMEFALTLPVFLFVVLAVADLSYFISALYDVQRAARDGCRLGSVTLEGAGTPTGDVIRAAAETHAKVVLAASSKPCSTGCSVTSSWFLLEGRRYLRVSVSYPHTPLTPGLNLVPTYLNAQFVMFTQQQ